MAVEAFEYRPAQGINRNGLKIEIGGSLCVGDESSLIPEKLVPLAKKQFRIDPEPPPFTGKFRSF